MPQSIGKIVRSFCQCSCDATEHWQNHEIFLSMFLWCHRALAKSWGLGFGILIPSTTKCLEALVLSMFLVILEIWFCILDFGVWIWRLGQHDMRQKRRKQQHGRKSTLPTRGESCFFFHRGKGPLLGGLSRFFLGVSERDGKPNPMNGTEKKMKKKWI